MASINLGTLLTTSLGVKHGVHLVLSHKPHPKSGYDKREMSSMTGKIRTLLKV